MNRKTITLTISIPEDWFTLESMASRSRAKEVLQNAFDHYWDAHLTGTVRVEALTIPPPPSSSYTDG